MGFTIDSLGITYGEEKETIRARLREGFRIDSNYCWEDVDCTLQNELECGPQTIWNMSLLCICLRRHIPLPLILEKIKTIDAVIRDVSAAWGRREMFHIYKRINLVMMSFIESLQDPLLHTQDWRHLDF